MLKIIHLFAKNENLKEKLKTALIENAEPFYRFKDPATAVKLFENLLYIESNKPSVFYFFCSGIEFFVKRNIDDVKFK